MQIFERYNCVIDSKLHEEFISRHNFKNIDDIVNFILNKFNLCEVNYEGDLVNRQQYELLTKNKYIKLSGDIENDIQDIKITDLLFVILTKNIPKPSSNRFITLYYKNEYNLTPGIVDDYEFLLHYKIVESLIKRKALKNFNSIRILCRHTFPEYLDELDCEKIIKEVGSKNFEILTSVYSNTFFYFNATLNFAQLKSRAILTPQCYELNICSEKTSYEKYNYDSFDFSIKDKIEDFFKWNDGTTSGFKDRFHEREKKYDIEKKLHDFVVCVLNIDKNPLCF
jgi:hypothetical protein